MNERIKRAAESRYFVETHVNGFIVMVGGCPMIIPRGAVACTWNDAVIAVRYGWQLKGGLGDGSVIVERQSI